MWYLISHRQPVLSQIGLNHRIAATLRRRHSRSRLIRHCPAAGATDTTASAYAAADAAATDAAPTDIADAALHRILYVPALKWKMTPRGKKGEVEIIYWTDETQHRYSLYRPVRPSF